MRFTAIKFPTHSLSDNYYARVYVEHRLLKHCHRTNQQNAGRGLSLTLTN